MIAFISAHLWIGYRKNPIYYQQFITSWLSATDVYTVRSNEVKCHMNMRIHKYMNTWIHEYIEDLAVYNKKQVPHWLNTAHYVWTQTIPFQ